MKYIATQSDLDTGLEALLKLDPSLPAIAKIAGPLPLRLRKPGFGALANIIIGQVVSRASAEAIYARFEKYVSPLEPKIYLELTNAAKQQIGLTRTKQQTIETLATAIVNNTLDLNALSTHSPKEAIDQLTQIRGIGQWTAEVYLLFCLGHPDIFPAGDLALQEAVRHALNLDKRPSEKELRTIVAHWEPWRGIAARLFWGYYREIKGGRER